MNIKEQIISVLGIKEFTVNDIDAVPENYEGDYSLSCFKLAKVLRKSPAVIAAEYCNRIECKGIVERLIPVGAYINIVVNKAVLAQTVYEEIYGNADFGKSDIGNGQTVCIDYSSITLSKHVHIGHLCTTVIGECLARLLENAGYKVVRINYLGDMGTPFGKIISMYKLKGERARIEQYGVDEIQRLYALFASEEEKDPQLIEDARAWSLKIEQGDPEATELCDWFKTVALNEAKRIYKQLGIDFDDWRGELYYNDKTQAVIELLEKKGLIVVSDGAKCVDLNEYGLGMCLIQRSDGGSLYTTRDLAAAIDRYERYHFSKSLYVTGTEQKRHFAAFFKVLELAGFEWAKDLRHIDYGRLSTQFGKISGREGNTPVMKDIFNAAIAKASAAVADKNLPEAIAEDIGVSAVAFSVLKTERIKDSVFSLDQAISFDGNSSVYIQYSYARLMSILAKQGELIPNESAIGLLTAKEEQDMLIYLDRFPEVLKSALTNYEPCFVSKYALDLAGLVNKFYNNVKVMSEDEELKNARLTLCKMAAEVLKKSMILLGVKPIEKM